MEFGNFVNYYKFNTAEERIKLLPSDIWIVDKEEDTGNNQPYLVLDVGCNAGNLAQLLWEFLTAHLPPPQQSISPNKTMTARRDVFILGIDLDAKLIERANAINTHAHNITYAHFDVMSSQYAYETPINSFLRKYQRTRFDAVCCFSITMWIHLNHGDTGLQHFLKSMCLIAKLLVVEPQPWKCYQNAKRRLKRSMGKEYPLYKKLLWREDVEKSICDYLKDLQRRLVYECNPTIWGRRVCFYR